MTRARVRDHLIDILYPSECVVCGTDFVLPVCTACFREFAAAAHGHDRVAGKAPGRVPRESWRAAGEYEGPFRDMVLAFKDGERRLASPLAALMAIAGGNDPKYLHPDAICFVPSTAAKLRKRGYNPAGLLAKELGKLLGRPVCDALRVVRRVSDQGSLNARERRLNVRGAFGPRQKAMPAGGILLVDDVLTTGATVGECAGVLLDNGAGSVCVSVCAHAG